jgi:hypothetical protein
MIAAHGKIVAVRVRVCSTFDLTHAPPENVSWVPVLFVTGNNAAFAADTLRHIEVKPILFSRPGPGRHTFLRDRSADQAERNLRCVGRDGCVGCRQVEGAATFLCSREQG